MVMLRRRYPIEGEKVHYGLLGKVSAACYNFVVKVILTLKMILFKELNIKKVVRKIRA